MVGGHRDGYLSAREAWLHLWRPNYLLRVPRRHNIHEPCFVQYLGAVLPDVAVRGDFLQAQLHQIDATAQVALPVVFLFSGILDRHGIASVHLGRTEGKYSGRFITKITYATNKHFHTRYLKKMFTFE